MLHRTLNFLTLNTAAAWYLDQELDLYLSGYSVKIYLDIIKRS